MEENIECVPNNPKYDRSDHIPPKYISQPKLFILEIFLSCLLCILGTSPKQKMDKYVLIFFFRIIMFNVLSILLLTTKQLTISDLNNKLWLCYCYTFKQC